jgi:hypothetical protein
MTTHVPDFRDPLISQLLKFICFKKKITARFRVQTTKLNKKEKEKNGITFSTMSISKLSSSRIIFKLLGKQS